MTPPIFGRMAPMSEKVARYLWLESRLSRLDSKFAITRAWSKEDDDASAALSGEFETILAAMSPAEKALVTWDGPGTWKEQER